MHRLGPITNITLDDFPKSSIGYGLSDKNEWIETYRDSKFCLCIRGDSPHSHAFFRSVRSGCVPVVASDSLPIFSPVFKNTLSMDDYAVVLKEQDLLTDPRGTLLQLQNLDKGYIEKKIKNLQFAQRVWFHDYPESLFVNAFLREALSASEVDDSMYPYKDEEWIDGNLVYKKKSN